MTLPPRPEMERLKRMSRTFWNATPAEVLDVVEYALALEEANAAMRKELEWMLSPESDWENGEIGVGSTFRTHARAALAAASAKEET